MTTRANKKTSTVTTSNAGQPSLTNPVPSEKAPVPPDYTQAKIGKGNRLKRSQTALSTRVATELRRYADYKEVFGATAPDADTVASALETANAWSVSLSNAQAWFKYVQQEAAVAERNAMTYMIALDQPFEIATSRDATIAEALPSTAKFFAVPKEAAQKGVATRKRKAAEAKATAAAAPAAAASATPTATTVASKSLN